MANEKRATLLIELKDFVSAGIGGISAKLAILRQGWMAVRDVVQTVIGVFQSFLNEYAAQEMAINKLSTALKNQGITSRAATEDLVDFATQLQNTTTIADEVALEAMALGTTFGLVGEDLKRTTKAAADMSAAMGIDLRTTMLLLGKAAVGETSTLTRYGVTISENIPKAQRFDEVLKQLNARFGGAAAAQTETYAGKLLQLQNAWSDMAETIGESFVPVAIKAIDLIKDTIVWWQRLLSIDDSRAASNKIAIEGYEKEIKLLEWKRDRIKGVSGSESESYKNTLIAIENRKKAIAVLQEETAALAKRNTAAGGGGTRKPFIDEAEEAARKKKNADLIADAQLRVDTEMLTSEQLANLKANQLAEELNQLGQHNLAIQLLENQQTKNTIAANEQRAANFRSTMGQISTLASSNNKTLAAIGKTAAVTQATMDTYAAANVALRSAPPPFNFGLAALVTAAGLANVARISGVKLAEGGMLMPRSGGVPAVMAEAGKAEVAIPLDDERTKEKLRDTLGGGGNTIIIQAGTIVADDYSVGQFAQKIDEKLFELKRNGRSYQ